MYQLFIKIILGIVFILSVLDGFSQDTGTFKVSKKKPEGTTYKPIGLYIGLNSILDGKKSPEKIRSYYMSIGLSTYVTTHYRLVAGAVVGKSHPSSEYQGFTIGVFTKFNYQMTIGPGIVYFPLEASYKKLINNLDHGNLNQYGLSGGISIPIYTIKGLYVTLLGSYEYETNSSITYKGIYPKLTIDFWF